MSTEEIQTAVYGVSLSDSESEALRDALAERKEGFECMFAQDIDASCDDVSGHHFNAGYFHAVGVVMGESTYADVAKLALKPPSRFAKKFDAEFKAVLASIGVARRPKGILVTQQRLPE
jgi:hypothetical protein